MASPSSSQSGSKPGKSAFGQIRETVVSLGISLVMAFIAKAYVIEAYVIPTGSMGPTLLGRHIRFDGPQTGYDWPVETWHKFMSSTGEAIPFPVQGGPLPNGQQSALPFVGDPMTVGSADVGPAGLSERGQRGAPTPTTKKVRAGDRILVQKYLYDFFDPERFDVVVFKNPTQAQQNYIKRLVALPNEHVWLLDGDIFTAPAAGDAGDDFDPARDAEWSIQRKPFDQQKRLWQRVFSSEYTPLRPTDNATGRTWFNRPWKPATEGWAFGDDGVYRYEGSGATALNWDSAAWPVDDWSWFNDFPGTRRVKRVFPVGDVRVRATVNGSTRFVIEVHDETFRASFSEDRVAIEARNGDDAWRTLSEADGLSLGRPRNLEFWFADQALSVVVDGTAVMEQVPIDWSAVERLERSTGLTLEASRERGARALLNPATYTKSVPRVAIELDGPTTLYRVGLDRDLYYRSAVHAGNGDFRAAFGGTPEHIATLGPDHFWLIGDNSTNSLDARAWSLQRAGSRIDPFVADQIDPAIGVVHRDLLLGKAFFVYWPAFYPVFESFPFPPVPDFGRMRFID